MEKRGFKTGKKDLRYGFDAGQRIRVVETQDGNHSTNLLATVWKSMRPSCPKRTTLGKYTLRILPPDWDDFVQFHVETLGCTFCNANLAELRVTSEAPELTRQHNRFFNSTIGFLIQSCQA